jgi:hypothetical protein
MASVIHHETDALLEVTVPDCLSAGWRRLRHAGVLVALLWLETLLVVLLTLGGLALPLAVVDFGPVHELAALDLQGVEEGLLWLAEDATWNDFVPRSPALVAALAGLAVLWTAALLVYCWFQAGLYGVLAEGASGSGSGFDFGRFADCGRRYLWRFFGLLHLFVLYLTGVLFLWIWVVWLAVWGWAAWGDPALLGIGCGGMLPVAFLAAVLALWFLLARADVARPGSGVRIARRRGWAVLRSRPGAVAALGALFLALGAVASGVVAPVSLVAGRLLEPWSGTWWVVRGSIEMASWGLYAAVAVFVGATTVALMVRCSGAQAESQTARPGAT